MPRLRIPLICAAVVLVATLIFGTETARTSPPVWSFIRLAGGPGADSAFAVTSGSDGIYVAGAFKDSASFGPSKFLTQGGSFDGFVAKMGFDGSWLWAQPITGLGNAGVVDLALLPDGDLLVLGSFDGSLVVGDFRFTSTALTRDVMFARISPEGRWLWARRLGGAYHDAATAITSTEDGGAVIVGNFAGSMAAGPGLLAARSLFYDVFVVKVAPDGSMPWATTAGGSLGASASDVASSPDGRVVVVGSGSPGSAFGSLRLRTTPNSSTMTGFMASIDATGTWSSLTPLSGSGEAAATTLTATDDGWLVGGTFTGSISTPSGSVAAANDSTDAFVASLTSTGVVRWVSGFGGLGDEMVSTILSRPDGSAMLLGSFDGPLILGGTSLHPAGGTDALFAEISPLGEVLWASSLGGPGPDTAPALTATPSGFAAAGALSAVDHPDAAGSLDVYVARLQFPSYK